MSGTFDPATFLDVTLAEANATATIPFDEGDYTAIAKEPVVRQWTSKDGSKSGIALDIFWIVDDAAQRAKIGREEVSCKQGIMLDLNANGGIDTGPGKNVKLGRLREALGLNKPGEPFNFRMIAGRPAKVKIKNRVEGEDIFSEVTAVAPLS
jgi:hypothetical protein